MCTNGWAELLSRVILSACVLVRDGRQQPRSEKGEAVGIEAAAARHVSLGRLTPRVSTPLWAGDQHPGRWCWVLRVCLVFC